MADCVTTEGFLLLDGDARKKRASLFESSDLKKRNNVDTCLVYNIMKVRYIIDKPVALLGLL